MKHHGEEKMSSLKITDLKIDPDFKDLLNELSDEQFLGLEEDICKRRKVYDPILVWSKDNSILDGHNRYKVIVAHKIDDFSIEPIDFDNKSDAMQWVIDHQGNRRNMTISEKVKAQLKVKTQLEKEAKERMLAGKSIEEDPVANLLQGSEPKKRNDAVIIQMAKKAGVSQHTFEDAALVVEKGTQKQIERMDKGGRGNGINTIAREVREGVSDGYRICSVCGEGKPIDSFVKGENGTYKSICKDCLNKKLREKRISADTHTDNTAEKEEPKRKKPTTGYIAPDYNPDYYNVNAVIEKSVSDIERELTQNFERYIVSVDQTLNCNSDVINSQKDRDIIANCFKRFSDRIKIIEGEIRNACN